MELDGVSINFLGHAGFTFSRQGKVIVVDPYNLSLKIPSADIVLITHDHYDHCSIKDIKKVVKKDTVVICPADCQSKLMKIEDINIQTVEWGDVLDFGYARIEAFPAYTIHSEDHSRGNGWLGFIIKFDKVIIYHSGDTDYIPEMQRLSGYGKKGNTFVALLPVAGGVVMDPEDAVEAASIINPDLSIPMSYGAGVYGTKKDAEDFVSICKDRNITARILDRVNS